MRLHFFFFFFTYLAMPAAGTAGSFRYTAQCEAAYSHYLSLQISNGNKAILQSLREDPENLLAVYIADYDDFLTLFINGDPAEYELRKAHFEQRIQALEKGDASDPYYRLCKSGLYLHWAIIHARFGEHIKATGCFRKSFLLIKDNRKRFPKFLANNVFYGFEEAIAGTIPDEYKWIAGLLGIRGNVKAGVVRLVAFLNAHQRPGSFLRAEAAVYYCYLKFYLQLQQDVAWNFLNSGSFSVKDNLLHAFVKANIALNYRKADIAVNILAYAQTLPGYKDYPSFDLEMGTALFLRSDSGCVPYLERFVRQNRGGVYTKDALKTLSLFRYLTGDQERANAYMDRIKSSGSLMTDADRQAERFARERAFPDKRLLRSRLYFDGGYYRAALNELSNYSEYSFSGAADQLEFSFRMGRIYDELNEDGKAIQYYQHTIARGKERKEHFAARAALQMAFIYEQHNQPEEAIRRFRQCLSMRNHDFQSSIDQQAKAGLNRLGASY